MTKYLAIVAYRCTIAAEPSDSVDLQVQYFDCQSPDEVHREIESAPLHQYANSDGEQVAWPLAAVIAIDEFSPPDSGDEVIGVITTLAKLAEQVSDEHTT